MTQANSRNRFKNWEYENQRQLLSMATAAQDYSKLTILRAARLTSFLLYLAYGGGKILWIIARGLFVGPELIQRVSPHRRALRRHEFSQPELQQYPPSWLR